MILAVVIPFVVVQCLQVYFAAHKGEELRNDFVALVVIVVYLAMIGIPCLIASMRWVVGAGLLAGLSYLFAKSQYWVPTSPDGGSAIGFMILINIVLGGSFALSLIILAAKYFTRRRSAGNDSGLQLK